MSTDQTANRESAAFPPINATTVAQAIDDIYLVLRPWHGADWANAEAAKCNVSSFGNIVKALQFQGRKFATAVDLSVKTSRDGIILARDSLTFLSAIEEERSAKDVMLYFQGLLEIAENSLDKARKCEQIFDEIRCSISRISNSVPKAMQAVEKRSVRVKKDARRRALVAERCQEGKEVIKEIRTTEGVFSGASPVGQGLQIALPILQAILHFAEISNQKKYKVRKQRIEALFDAIGRLQTLDKHLFNVYNCLHTLVVWWSNIKAQLKQIQDDLEHHGISLYRNDINNSVRDSWNHIREEYSEYRDEVSTIQDRYYDMVPFDGMDVGRKGALLGIQGGIEDFYQGLTDLKAITGTKADDHTKLQDALSSIEAGFISRLEMIDCCLEELQHCIRIADPIQRSAKYGHVISIFFHALLTSDDDYALSLANELENIHHLLTSDYSGARALLNSMKMRLKNHASKTGLFQIIIKMEEKNQEISNFSVELFANGLWHVDENIEECLLQTRHKCTWFKAKLEHNA